MRAWRRMGPTAVLLAAALCLGGGSALAQPRFLPASEYGRINLRTPQAVQLKLEALQASNDFERVGDFREGSRYRLAANPIGRLQIMVRRDGGRMGMALCTASVLSAEHILTNYHCIPGAVNLTVLQANLQMDYLDENETERVRGYEVDIEPVEADPELDYAILRVQGNPARDFGTVTISALAPQVREAVFIIHHPEGKPKTLSRKDCWVEALTGPQFIHTCDTLGGSSGSPIFADETFQVVGLHFAGSEQGNYGKSIAALLARSRVLESLAVIERPAPAGGGTASRPASTPAPPRERPNVRIALDSQPPGAAIVHAGTVVGLTPLRFKLAPRPSYTFELRRDGYEPATLTVEAAGGRASGSATLRRAPGATTAAASSVPGRFDPAADQMAKALDFWAQLDKSGFTATGKDRDKPGEKDPSAGRSAAAEQQRKADAMFKQFGQ